jgi:hypothetical protein
MHCASSSLPCQSPRFPVPYRVESVTIYEAARQGWPTDRSYWQLTRNVVFAAVELANQGIRDEFAH